MLTMNDIREKFITFFKENGHEVVRSSSLIPKDDPSLLFTNAGMVQFKKIFQGLEQRDYCRATTSQKCLRVGGKHNDLENVGRTARHHTFFEMLGNFSFGDYFKEDAIKLAWKFITTELHLPKDRLYVTIFLDDDEACELWQKHTDIPAERIIRMGEKDNFWSMGDSGPCGPCSEIHIDQGEHMKCGENCGIGQCDCDRFLEIWNLVFMQFNQIEPGVREKLAKPSIDTGMGLERIAAVCQGVYSNFDTDLFKGIIEHACTLANVSYSSSMPDTNDTDTALRVIADHSRSIAFMVADGIMPSNEGRGYVLRRLIRRAYRFGHLIGMPSTFLYKMATKVTQLMGNSFPELETSLSFMQRLIKEEEERFAKTLVKGLSLLQSAIDETKSSGKNSLSGDVAFKLYDTYGFPLDIVNDICEKQNIHVDEDGFNGFMKEQKLRAKAAWKGSGESDIVSRFASLLEDGISSSFVGYTQLEVESRIIALLNAEGESVSSLAKEEKGWLVTGITPFYGASGGQDGDTGTIKTPLGRARVIDAIKPSDKLTVLSIHVEEGSILLDSEATLRVEDGARLASARNHTCTHLLQAALRKVLGDHVHQAGSLVTPDRLRFDFSHMSAMTQEEILKVEQIVNTAIMADFEVSAKEQMYEEAVASGATALFGEKYADEVRVITIADESCELCGGTHLSRTGQAGSFAILSESGVAAGVRRIEAVTGWNTLRVFKEQQLELLEAHAMTKTRSGELIPRIEILQKEVKESRKALEKMAGQAASSNGKKLVEQAKIFGGIPMVAAKVDVGSIKALRELMDDVRSKVPTGVACLAMELEGKVSLLVAVSKDLHNKVTAPDIIKSIAPAIHGSGGGRPELAQAGGDNPAGIQKAFGLLEQMLS